MTIDPALKVADIARQYPGTLAVFAKYRIDLCCGGQLPLEVVARKHAIDLERLLRELEEAVPVKA